MNDTSWIIYYLNGIFCVSPFKWEQMFFFKKSADVHLFCKLAWRLIFSSYMTLIHLLVFHFLFTQFVNEEPNFGSGSTTISNEM